MKSLHLNSKNSLYKLWAWAIAGVKAPMRSLVSSFCKVQYLTEVTPSDIVKRKFHGRSSVFFVQLGSNDGLNGDPLHDLIQSNPEWRGIFVEPVRYAFDRLRSNYNDEKRFVFENIAIADSSGEADFFCVSEDAKRELEDLPDWYDQLGSFNREHLVKHLEGRLEPFILMERVKCETLAGLLDRNHVTKIDLLHIDVEGFDYNILKQIDFLRHSPEVILFEHKHLTPENQRNARFLLAKYEYTLAQFGGDTVALRRMPPDATRNRAEVARARPT